MKSRVQKWGNSLALRIPKSFAEELEIKNSSPVAVSVEEGALVIKPDRDRMWDLHSLLARITDENVHPEWAKEPLSEGEGGDGPEGKGE
jgi:antitoxin MazE